MSDYKQNKPPRHGGPMGGMNAPVEKAKDFKGTLKRLLHYLRPHRLNLILVFIFAVLSTVFTIAAPKIMSHATNKLQNSYMASKVLTQMEKGQNTAMNQMSDKLSDAQQTILDKSSSKIRTASNKATNNVTRQMAKAQKKSVEQIIKKMGTAQTKASRQMYTSVAKQIYQGVRTGQLKADDQITQQMAKAQTSMCKKMSKQLNTIQKAQAAAAKAQAAAQAASAQAQASSSPSASSAAPSYAGSTASKATQKAAIAKMAKLKKTVTLMKKLIAMKRISQAQTRSEKIKRTLAFLNALESMPSSMTSNTTSAKKSSATFSKKKIEQAKKCLNYPLLDTVPYGSKKVSALKAFSSLASSLSSHSDNASAITLSDAQMERVYEEMAKLTDFTVKNSSNNNFSSMSSTEKNALQDFLNLPSIEAAKSMAKKKSLTLQFIQILQNMPSTGSVGTTYHSSNISVLKKLFQLKSIQKATSKKAQKKEVLQFLSILSDMPADTMKTSGSKNTFSKKDISIIQELYRLPTIKSTDSDAKQISAVTKAITVFQKLSKMNIKGMKSSSSKTMNTKTLDAMKKMLALPKIKDISSRKEQIRIMKKMLDLFDQLPASAKSSGAKTTKDFNKKTIKAVEEFISLPQLSTLHGANERATTCRRMMKLSKKLTATMSNSPDDPVSKVKFTNKEIDTAIHAVRTTNGKYDFVYIGKIVILLICLYVISALFSLIMGLLMSGVAQRTVCDLRREVDEKLAKLPLSYYDRTPHGDILSRVTNDVDTISQTLQQSLTQIITSVITIIGYIIMMVSISGILTLIVLATMPLYVLTTIFIAKRSQRYFASQQKEIGLLSGHVEEMYTGHKIVKAFGYEKKSIREFDDINARLTKQIWKAQFVSGIMFPLMNFVSNLGYVGISIVGGLWITKSLLGLGDILAFIQYSKSFTMPIVQTANIANIIQSTVACAERVFQILDEEEEIPDRQDAITIERPQGFVDFEHVDFSYLPDVSLIEDMNLHVQPGHTVAIVGPTGAGKTTLVNLLMRFYEINAGRICIDGVNINDMTRNGLRKMFGMVLQDTWLFHGTIFENIAYGKENATEDEVIAAAKSAHAHHFIQTLPQGYQTILNEEATNISQGQKQLLTIARAILANPSILILDEATSSVDTRTEMRIQKAMNNLMKDRSSFVIAHRLSTIRDAETILVMNKGKIIEMGNHQQLIAKKGFYADLYQSQFSGASI